LDLLSINRDPAPDRRTDYCKSQKGKEAEMDRSFASIIGVVLLMSCLSLLTGCSSCGESGERTATPKPTPTVETFPTIAPGEGVTGSWEIVVEGEGVDRIDIRQVGDIVEGKSSNGRLLAGTVTGNTFSGTLGGPSGVTFTATVLGDNLTGTYIAGRQTMAFAGRRLR
jgi:hypothetical protein